MKPTERHWIRPEAKQAKGFPVVMSRVMQKEVVQNQRWPEGQRMTRMGQAWPKKGKKPQGSVRAIMNVERRPRPGREMNWPDLAYVVQEGHRRCFPPSLEILEINVASMLPSAVSERAVLEEESGLVRVVQAYSVSMDPW